MLGNDALTDAYGRLCAVQPLRYEPQAIDTLALEEQEALDTRRSIARKSARAVAKYAKLHPLIMTPRYKKYWVTRPDDWVDSYRGAHTHEIWGDAERVAGQHAGRPPTAQHQQMGPSVAPLASSSELTIPHAVTDNKERVLQLQSQQQALQARLRQMAKHKADEERAAAALAERLTQRDWYHRQREQRKKGIPKAERKAAQQRLYAVNVRAPARVYC